jgi:hypothetical protein
MGKGGTMKTYTTIVGAYTAAQKAGAKSFGSDYYAYASKVDELIASTFKSANARTFAKWNLAKFEKTLCALECTSTKEGKDVFQWTAIGHFDSEGLLYPMNTEAKDEKPTEAQTEDKPTPKKPRPRKPTPAKGNGIDFSTFKGTNSEKNRALHAELVSRGLKDSRAKAYQDIWNSRPWAQK